MPFMSKIKGAFEDILASGSVIPNHVFSYAILGSLPSPYSILATLLDPRPLDVHAREAHLVLGPRRCPDQLALPKPPTSATPLYSPRRRTSPRRHQTCPPATTRRICARSRARDHNTYCGNHKRKDHEIKDCWGVEPDKEPE